MNKKQKKQARVAMAVALAATSVAHSTGRIFAQNEPTMEELNSIDTVENKIEIEDLESPVEEAEDLESIVENPLENIENTALVEKAAGDLEINETNFPDLAFRQYISTNFDIDQDGVLSSDEINRVTRIELFFRSDITSLEGIEYFPNLEYLNCYYTNIMTLDVSKNTALTYLDCSGTGITELDVSKNTALTYLECYGTGITELDVSKNTALTYLYCNNTGITELDVSNNTALTYLRCSSTGITELDVSKNTALISLNCDNTGITELDVSNNTALTNLDCYNTGITELDVSYNTALTSLDCSQNSKLISMDVSKNTALTSLYCYNTGITELDVSKNTALTYLECYGTGITELDVSKNTALERLDCYYTNITTLDVRNNTALNYLNCSNTGITELDVSNNTALERLLCNSTGITELDISNNTALTSLNCDNTGITELDVSRNTALTNLYCNNTGITELDVTKNTALTYLGCYNTGITELDVSKNTALNYLDCSNTGITELDVSNNTALNYLDCSNTGITELDVSNNTALERLLCNSTGITELDVSNNTVLYDLNCSNTGITELDVSKNTSLSTLYCNNTGITGLDVTNNSAMSWLYMYDNNLAWLNIGDKPNLYGLYMGTSNIDLGEVENTFNIADLFPGIDLDKITITGGASLDKTTGVVSGYANGTPITYTYDCGTRDNGNAVSLDVTLNFSKKKDPSSIIINDDLNKVYDGQAVTEPTDIEVTGSAGSVSIEWYTADDKKLDEAPVNVGSYKVKVILAEDSNYNGIEVEKEFEITKANNQWIQELSIENWSYGEAEKEPSAEVQFGTVEFTYSTTEDGVYTVDVPSIAGTYWVKATVTGTNNYDGLEAKKSFTIEKASSVITIDNDLNKLFDGTAVAEPQVRVTGSTGTVSIEWYQKEETTTKAITWKKLAAAPSAIGDYKVVVTVGEDGNYIETTKEQEFSILQNKVVIPTPGAGGVVTNPDGNTITVTPNDKLESNGPATINPDGSIVFPNGGTVTRPDGSTETIQPGGVLTPNQVEVIPGTGGETTTTPAQGVTGVQTGDSTQVGLWTMLVGLSTGLMMYFRKKNRKEEV